MGATMLHGVLNMPPELWGDSKIDKTQRHYRYVEASKRINELEGALRDLLSQIDNCDGAAQICTDNAQQIFDKCS